MCAQASSATAATSASLFRLWLSELDIGRPEHAELEKAKTDYERGHKEVADRMEVIFQRSVSSRQKSSEFQAELDRLEQRKATILQEKRSLDSELEQGDKEMDDLKRRRLTLAGDYATLLSDKIKTLNAKQNGCASSSSPPSNGTSPSPSPRPSSQGNGQPVRKDPPLPSPRISNGTSGTQEKKKPGVLSLI